jgi:hypothetical protein
MLMTKWKMAKKKFLPRSERLEGHSLLLMECASPGWHSEIRANHWVDSRVFGLAHFAKQPGARRRAKQWSHPVQQFLVVNGLLRDSRYVNAFQLSMPSEIGQTTGQNSTLLVLELSMFALTLKRSVADCASPELIDQVDFLSGLQQD